MDRKPVADATFDQYIESIKASYYLADTEGWNVDGNCWTRKYWLGSRTRLNTSERVFFIDFVTGIAVIERQWQE